MAEAKLPKVAQRVEIIDKKLVGVVAFVGETSFQAGQWIGVVLDEPKGKNNGTVQGVEYFKCSDKFGMFVRPHQVKLVDSGPPKTGLRAPQTKRTGIKPPSATAGSKIGKGGSSGSSTPRSESRESLTQQETSAISTSSVPPTKSEPILENAPTTDVGLSQLVSEQPVASPTKSDMGPPALPSGIKSPTTKTAIPQKSFDKPPPLEMPANLSEHRPSVAERVAQIKKDGQGVIPSPAANAAMSVGMELGGAAELDYLRMEVRDLQEKLETLRMKRVEDKDKLKEYEKQKIHIQQLQEYKNKMSEQHTDLQRQLQAARKDAEEAISTKDIQYDEMSEASERLELAVLDKETAEEKCEILESETKALQEELENIKLDLQIAKEEFDGKISGTSDGSEPVGIKVKQLEAQNDKLKEAVVRLRDMVDGLKAERDILSKEQNSSSHRLKDAIARLEKLERDNKTLEQQNVDLKEQVDLALGAETMVEQLTEKNLKLEEQVQDYQEQVDGLEQLKEMDAEINEDIKEQEKDARMALESAQVQINDMFRLLEAAKGARKDQEKTIDNFRRQTGQLNEQIQDLKDQLAIAQDRKNVGSGDGLSNNVIMSKTAHSQVIEARVQQVVLESQKLQNNCLRTFLPDNFNKPGGDGDGLFIVMLFSRLHDKAKCLIDLLYEKYPVPPGGMNKGHVARSHKAEQWSFVDRFVYYLKGLLVLLKKYESVLIRCSVERLARLAQLRPELAAQEKNVDYYLDLLKAQRLDENTSTEQMRSMLTYFENLYTAHLVNEPFAEAVHVSLVASQFIAGIKWAITDLNRVKLYLPENSTETKVYAVCDEYHKVLKDADSRWRAILTRASSNYSDTRGFKFTTELHDTVADAKLSLEKAAGMIWDSCTSAANQITLAADDESLTEGRLLELLEESKRKVAKSDQRDVFEFIRFHYAATLGMSTKTLADAIEKGEYDYSMEKPKGFPPLVERAHARKQDAVEADGLRWQIEKKDNEVMDLKKALRMKAEEISEMQVRKEMAEKRLQSSGKEGDERVNRLDLKVKEQDDDYKKKERELERTIDTLQQDVDQFSKENTDLKGKVKDLTKQVLLKAIVPDSGGFGSSMMIPTMASPSSTNLSVNDSPLLHEQMEQLKAALRVAQQQKYQLSALKMRRDLQDLPPLNVPDKPTGLHNQTGLFDLDRHISKADNSELNSLRRDVNRLQKNYLDFVKTNRVIDITNRKPGRKFTLEKSEPSYKVSTKIMELKMLTDFSNDLKHRMAKQMVAKSVKTSSNANSILVGRLTLPATNASDAGKTISVQMDSAQLKLLSMKLTY